MIGTTLAHYEVLEEIGRGGMGVVYKARDTHLDRFVAIKVLPAEAVVNPERKRRFVQEAKSASALNHANIVTIHDIAEENGVDFIAMEYVPGKTLDELIPRKGMRLNDVLKYSVQIADALATAHEAGIVHRDMKPGNIMVTEKGEVKVLDFGLAKLTEMEPAGAEAPTQTIKGPSSSPHTEEGTILGTVCYMSPEQAEGKSVDGRSDIFSFGAVLYEMVAGQRAFAGDSRMSTLAAVMNSDPRPLQEVVDTVPLELERIVSRCLRKQLDRRFQHMDDIKIELEELKEESESGRLATAPGTAGPRSRRVSPWLLVGTAATVVAVVMAGWFWQRRERAVAPEAALSALPITSYSGQEEGPTFSPDGRQVAFSWNGADGNNFDIYVKRVESGQPLRLTKDPAMDTDPAWSPDGSFIAFRRILSSGKVAVLLVPPLGGPARTAGEILSPSFSTGLAWHPDGEHLCVVARESRGERYGLFLLSTGSGEMRRLTSPSLEWDRGEEGPSFSPDGRTIVFTRHAGRFNAELFRLALSEDLTPVGEPERLTFESLTISDPTWTPDGSEIMFSMGANTTPSLYRMRPSPSDRPSRLPLVGEGGVHPAISAPARRLAYTRVEFDADIWRIEIGGPDGKTARSESLIHSSRWDSSPRYSPDGQRIAFRSDRSGNAEIWVCDSDGANAVQVTSFGGPHAGGPNWSPDGKWIVFVGRPEGQQDLYVISSEGGRPRRLTSSYALDANPDWSHDGQWIYFRSNRTGTNQVWKIPAEGGEAVRVTHETASQRIGTLLLESPDGRFVYYARIGERGLSVWRVPVSGGEESQILDSISSRSHFFPSDRGVYYVAPADPEDGFPVRFLDLASGKIREITTLPNNPGWAISPSPDGKFLLYTRTEQAGSDLMLVENFQ